MFISQVSCYVNIINNALDKYLLILINHIIHKTIFIVNYWFNTDILFVGIDNEYLLLLLLII